MNHVLHLRSLISGRTFRPDEIDYVDPEFGTDGIVDVVYDYDLIKRHIMRDNRDYSVWRYKPLLPVEPDATVPPLQIGWTPLYSTPRLAADLGLRHLWVKDDGRNPTASFKDRASVIAVVKAQERGAQIITTASTGNAAAALSGICASVGQANVIFVPEKAPQAKVAQLLAYGSTVMLVRGKYDDALAAYEKVLGSALAKHDTDVRFRATLEGRTRLREAVVGLMDRWGLDALIYPHKLHGPLKIGHKDDPERQYRPNQMSPVTGLPALIAPMGFTEEGLPVGLEILGRPWSEPTLIKLASGFEAVTDNRRVPESTPPLPGESFEY